MIGNGARGPRRRLRTCARVGHSVSRVGPGGGPRPTPKPGDRFAFCARFVLELLLHGVQLTLY